jgi:hypothetical protein
MIIAVGFTFMFASHGMTADVHKESAKSVWGNIKAVKQPEPNIPKEYKDLEKAYYSYWDHIIKKDYEKAYAMESSDYKKANPYKEDLYSGILARNMKLTAVLGLTLDTPDKSNAVVKGRYYYSVGAFKTVREFKDSWIKEDAGWLHSPVEGQFFKKQEQKK